MKILNLANDRKISTVCTQKEIAQYLQYHYCIPKAETERAIKEARVKNWSSTELKRCGRVIIIYTIPRKMFIASCSVSNWNGGKIA